VLRRFRERLTDFERSSLCSLFPLAAYFLLSLLTAETLSESTSAGAWSLVALIWSAGAAGMLAAGLRWWERPLRGAGLIALLAVALLGVEVYGYESLSGGHRLFWNERFGACLVGALVLFGAAWSMQMYANRWTEEERSLWGVLCSGAIAALLVLLSAEVYVYCRAAFPSGQQANWSAQTGLTIVWSVYATGMLAVGFWRRWRALRFAALALFAVTALKLAFVDLARLDRLYRIVSFFVMGLLMIGASYLYHKAEKRLMASDESDAA
jgi:hypothetical protein